MTACMLNILNVVCIRHECSYHTNSVRCRMSMWRSSYIGHGFECSGTNSIALVCGNTALHESLYMVLIWHCVWC